MTAWHSLPLFVRLEGRPVILLGEGEAADAKRRLLERAGAVAVRDHPDARLAIVAIDDEAAAIAAAGRLRARGLLVNVVDRPALCDFTVPAIVDRAPVLVAIGTGGVSAGLAAALRQRLEALFPAGLGALAEALYGARARIRVLLPDGRERRRAIGAALDSELDPLRGGNAGGVDAWLDRLEAQPSPRFSGGGRGPAAMADVGKREALPSTILQLGPGLRRGTGEVIAIRLTSPDPDDLTLRQARALAQADRVVHSPAMPAAILDRARADAARIAQATPPTDAAPGLTVWLEMRG